MPIKSFKDKLSAEIAHGRKNKETIKKLPTNLHYIAYKKLIFLDNIGQLESLKAWPSLRLEKLSGNRKGQYSIRINNKYRICFYFINGNSYEVEIIDYH